MIDPALIRHALPERLTTERLELRRDAVEDTLEIYEAIEASRAELAPWLDWATPDFDFKEALRAQQRSREYWNAGDSFQWRIWLRDGDAKSSLFLGSIDLHTVDWSARTAELGYWLDSRVAGHGYLTEAGLAIVEIAFTLLGFAELSIFCHTANTRSIAVARRLGFHSSLGDVAGAVCLRRRGP